MKYATATIKITNDSGDVAHDYKLSGFLRITWRKIFLIELRK